MAKEKCGCRLGRKIKPGGRGSDGRLLVCNQLTLSLSPSFFLRTSSLILPKKAEKVGPGLHQRQCDQIGAFLLLLLYSVKSGNLVTLHQWHASPVFQKLLPSHEERRVKTN